MAERKLLFKAGINKQLTPTLNEGGWSDGDTARFKDGLGQKAGGYTQFAPQTFQGYCRGLHAAVQLDGQTWLGVGTNLRLYLVQGGAYYDITPIRLTTDPMANNPFHTTSGSSTVTVTDAAHDAIEGDYVIYDGATAGNNVTVDGEYTIASVVNANSYTITVATVASGTGNVGGAAVVAEYLISPGPASAGSGFGWGVGPWGGGTWGTARPVGLTTLMLRLWSIDHWGEDMIACPRGGGYYQWVAADGPAVRAVQVTNAPTLSAWAMIGAPERHAIAYGADTSGTQDPMLIRWSDVEDLTDWTATATNSAGSFRLNGGTRIQNALRTANEILVWTDAALFSQQFVGLPYVYSFRMIGQNCGVIAPNAAATHNGITCWMDSNAFHIYTGAVRTLPCDVWDYVFNNLNRVQIDKIYACPIEFFNEIRWYYPSTSGSGENDLFVSVCLDDYTWNIGTRSRTAQITAGIYHYPIATGSDFMLYYEEITHDANGAALRSYLETGYIDLADGTEIIYLDRIIPDFTLTGTINVYVKGRMYPGGDTVTKGPFVVTTTTRWINPRIRCRQVAFLFESNEIGAFYRMGAVRANASPNGRN